MARPRRSECSRPADLKCIDAFWELLEKHALKDITVGKLVSSAGLSRATFYYYFKDLDDLVDRALKYELTGGDFGTSRGIFAATTGVCTALEFDEETRSHVYRIVIAIEHGGPEEIGKRIVAAVLAMWQELLHPDGAPLSSEAAVIIEYTVSGNLGMLIFFAQDTKSRERKPSHFVHDFLYENTQTLIKSLSAAEDISEQEIHNRIAALTK